MKKIAMIAGVVVLFFLGLVAWLYYVNLTNVDEFRLNGYSLIEKESVVPNEPVYLSYELKYHGNGKPTITGISFIKRDGSFLSKDDESLAYEVFVDEKAETSTKTSGVVTDKEAMELKLIENYLPVENYKVTNQDINLVIKVTIKNEDYTNNVTAMQIDYDLLGSPEMKQFLFTGFVAE